MKHIAFLARITQQYMTQRIKNTDLCTTECMILRALYKSDGATQDKIARFLSIDKSSVTRLVSALERKGYVRRETLPEDKRYFQVFLEPKGFRVVPIIWQISEEWMDFYSSDLSEEERAMLQGLLAKLSTKAKYWAAQDFEEITKEQWEHLTAEEDNANEDSDTSSAYTYTSLNLKKLKRNNIRNKPTVQEHLGA